MPTASSLSCLDTCGVILMNRRMTKEERENLIVDGRPVFEPEEAEDLGRLADLLADPSTWAEPSFELEDAVVRAVASAQRVESAPRQVSLKRERALAPRWRWRIALSAAAAIVVIAGTILATQRAASPGFGAALAATSLAPDARATANITRNNGGFRVALHASGLPSRPPGA